MKGDWGCLGSAKGWFWGKLWGVGCSVVGEKRLGDWGCCWGVWAGCAGGETCSKGEGAGVWGACEEPLPRR